MNGRPTVSARLALLSLALAACGTAREPATVQDDESQAGVIATDRAALAEIAASPPSDQPPGLAAMQAALKLIRTATLTVEVERFDSAAAAVGRIAEASGGYVADAQRSQDARGHWRGVVTLRVPAERFGSTLEALKGLGDVQDETQSTQDVTKAYTDLEIRITIKREAAQRLRDILANRTGRLSDVLDVERELSRVVEEIERMEGERRFYDQQVAMSTITATLYEPGAERGEGPLAPITVALGNAVRTLATSVGALIYVIAYLAPWLVLALLGWFGTQRIRAAIARRKA